MIRNNNAVGTDVHKSPIRKLKMSLIQKLEKFGSLRAGQRCLSIEMSINSTVQVSSVLNRHEIIRVEVQ
jgi:hypothetical protein